MTTTTVFCRVHPGADGAGRGARQAVPLPRDEYTDLKKAVARYKADGNRFLAE